MKKGSFQFKQFTIYQDRCAMKVGMDGVLLGCWCPLPEDGQILDIGTGTGLIALMIAQRHPSACVTGIDIDGLAVEQARENAALCPWTDRLRFIQADANDFAPDMTFSAIVCNPPFFIRSLQGPDARRNQARHTDRLPFESLTRRAEKLLSDNGLFSVVIPYDCADDFIQFCWESGLNLLRKCIVVTKPGKFAKRVLLTFKKGNTNYPVEERLHLMEPDGETSQAYMALTKDFYLDR